MGKMDCQWTGMLNTCSTGSISIDVGKINLVHFIIQQSDCGSHNSHAMLRVLAFGEK
jgi:hypothetical protein